MAQETPITYETIMELPSGGIIKGKPMHVEIGIIFQHVQITRSSSGWAPAIIFCHNLRTGESYTRKETGRLINPKQISVALDGIGWVLANDPDADPEEKAFYEKVCGKIS